MDVAAPRGGTAFSLFDGVPREELEDALARLRPRVYPAGTVIVGEGDTLRDLFIVRSGVADVLIADRHGGEHAVARLGPGDTVGEMSLLTAQPAAATVRAVEDVEAIAVGRADFDRLGARFPGIYRNVGAILADRLARTNRLTIHEEPGRLSVLVDRGAPPELAYAIAAGIAWHSRAPTVLLVPAGAAGDGLPPALDAREALERSGPEQDGGARLATFEASSAGDFAELLAAFCLVYDHVVIASPAPPQGLDAGRTVEIGGNGARSDDAAYSVEAWAPGHSFVGPNAEGLIRVPELGAEDRRALAQGLLPGSTPAGRKIGWIARDLAGLKVGIALGAGSARGFAHFGVLRALERIGVFPDVLVGTSAGAAAAALYAIGHSPDRGAELFLGCGPSLFRPRISTRSFLSNRAFSKYMSTIAGDTRIEELPYPFAAVAADVVTQREVVYRRGLVWRAVVASISIPGIYPALNMGPYTVVDGGVLDPVPSSVCAEMGADAIIAVKLGAPTAQPDFDADAVPATGRPPPAIPTLVRSLEMMQARFMPENETPNTIILTPASNDVATGSLRNFKAGMRLVAHGEETTQAAVPRIAAALPWLRG